MILEDKIDIDYDNKTITFNGKTVNYTDWEDKEQKIKEMMTDEELSKITETEIDKYLEESFDKYEMPCSYEDYYGNMEYETYKTDLLGRRKSAFNCSDSLVLVCPFLTVDQTVG